MAAKKTAATKTAPVPTEEIVNVKETVKVEKKPVKAEKAEAVKKEAPKAETGKQAETKAAEPKAAAKKPAARKATKKAVKTSFVVQAAGKEVTMEEAVARATADWALSGNSEADLKEIALYVKPEEQAIYYVINGKATGRVDF